MPASGTRLLRALALVALGAVLATAAFAVAKKKTMTADKPKTNTAI